MKRLTVTPGFWLSAAAIWALEPGLLLPAALAAGCHELGHCAALTLLGSAPKQLKLCAAGAELVPRRPLSYAGQLPAALAGPAVSLIAAVLAARWGFFLFAGLSLALGLFNLLPIPPLDGGLVLQSLCALVLPTPMDRKVPRWLAVCVAGLLLGVAVRAFLRFAVLSLLALAVWLCWKSVRGLLEF